MIDTHAHLEEILGEVDKIVLASSDIKSAKKNLQLAEKYKFLKPAVGIHPQSPSGQMGKLEKLINKKVVAIGECGLDFGDDYDQKKQMEMFRHQIDLSQKYKLPLIIHARKAVDETVEVLKSYKNLFGVFHCYAGGNKRIKKIMELEGEWYFGIDGNLTYEVGLAEVVKNIPKNRLVLETDCPYLTPVPFRGEINKPAYVEYVYKKVGEIWQMNFETTEKIIDDNAKRLFGI